MKPTRAAVGAADERGITPKGDGTQGRGNWRAVSAAQFSHREYDQRNAAARNTRQVAPCALWSFTREMLYDTLYDRTAILRACAREFSTL